VTGLVRAGESVTVRRIEKVPGRGDLKLWWAEVTPSR
jgi:hypothetical protein